MSDALLNSKAVFKSRASELQLEIDAIDKAESENIGTLGQFGFRYQALTGPLIADFKRPLKPFKPFKRPGLGAPARPALAIVLTLRGRVSIPPAGGGTSRTAV